MRKLLFIAFLFPALCFGQRFHFASTAHLAASSSYTAEYQAVLNAMTVDPTGDTLTWQNNLCYSLDTAGLWDRMDIFYLFAQNDSNNAKINWIDPGTFNAAGRNSPAFTRNEGFTGNGSSSYLDTNYNPSINGTNYSLNSATLGIYLRKEQKEDRYCFGNIDAQYRTVLGPRWTDNTFTYAVNQLSTACQYPSNSVSAGLSIATRTASNAAVAYMNGSSKGSSSGGAAAIPNVNFRILRYSSTYSTQQVSIAFVMDGVTATDAADLNTIVETYMDAIGKGVQ